MAQTLNELMWDVQDFLRRMNVDTKGVEITISVPKEGEKYTIIRNIQQEWEYWMWNRPAPLDLTNLEVRGMKLNIVSREKWAK